MAAERRLRLVCPQGQIDAVERDERLLALADHCTEAKKLVDSVGTDTMRRLADLLLFEIGLALAEQERTAEASTEDDPA